MDYRFGPWRIAVQARELWRDDALQSVARRVFECLAYLIEHRERAVGRDELVAALWGRVDVADVLVSQLIARARKAIGDDAQSQRAIRTIPGFGYRWVMPLEEAAATPIAMDDMSAMASIPPATPAAAQEWAPPRRTRFWLYGLAIAVAAIAATVAWRNRLPQPVDVAQAAGDAVIVLPFEVDASREAGWLRLGAMDLVGERLRGAGLAVPASETVLVALHAHPGDAGGIGADAMRMLGAHMIVHGRVWQSADGWRVELAATDGHGARHTVSASRPVPTDAARQASDLLLAALGHADAMANLEGEHDALDERLQRAQAAILSNEFATARAILDQADPADRDDPRLRFRLAQIDFMSGRLDEADAVLRDLLAHADALPGDLQANVRVARGMLAMRRSDCADAESDYDTAVQLLQGGDAVLAQGNALAGRGIARACLRRYDESANDLGLARTRMTSAGDALGLARVDNYLGLLDADRNRLADALADFHAAAATFERFGAIDALRAVLNGQLEAQSELLQHADALATSERLWALRARVTDPGQRLALDANRARALLGVGRLQAAAQVLAGADADLALPLQAGYARYVYAERAHLAALNGDRGQAAAAARKALADGPWHSDDTLRARTELILRRASADDATGTIDAAHSTADADAADAPIAMVIQAEAAQRRGDTTAAGQSFARALAAAEADGVPATTATVAIAHAHWLLGQGRVADAAEVGGRVARWADRDFDCALLQVTLYHALGRDDLRLSSLREAESLAGERSIPATLRESGAGVHLH